MQLARNCAYGGCRSKHACLLMRNPALTLLGVRADLAKYNIRCNSVCAGTIETPISAEERAAHGWTYEEWQVCSTSAQALPLLHSCCCPS